ncbi:MAG: Crp/Fnr family transcriptional regulator [Candidatus Eisenbacteria bacterium]
MSAHPVPTLALRLARLVPGMGVLDPALARAIEHEAVAVERPAGAVLFDTGSPCSGLLLLEDGLVRVSRVAEDGRELQLYRVEPGETCVLTVSCLLGRADYPARGVADRAVQGVYLPAPLFERLSAASAPFRAFVFQAFSERVTSLVDLAAAVTFGHLDRRLARALLERVRTSGRIVLTVTHTELAAELASARESVSRLLGGLADAGVIEQGRGTVRVLDKPRLEAMAGGAPLTH